MAAHSDRQWMRLAIRLGRDGLGATGDNPSVGCVIVRETVDGWEVIGRGRTGDGGRPHGEVQALAMAGEEARGATLYVTLEPCSHFGKSPPCADAIIKAGIARVVVAVKDPNPVVSGDGLARLKDAGIEVETGVLVDEASWATAGHLLRFLEERPFVQLKIAVSSDGLIAPGDGAPQWVTGPQSRARGHLLRGQADGILVGIGTVLADDPKLDCRLPGLEGQSPVPVVLDSQLRTPLRAHLVMNSNVRPLRIFCAPVGDNDDARVRAEKLRNKGVVIHEISLHDKGQLDPVDVLRRLKELGITRLMIEGGPRVAQSFLGAGLIDEVVIFRGDKPVDGDGLLPLSSDGIDIFDDPEKWLVQLELTCGVDLMMVKRNRKTQARFAQVQT